MRVFAYTAFDDVTTVFDSGDGLLTENALTVDTLADGSIWAGSVGGASQRRAGEDRWYTYGSEHGLHGAVTDVGLAPDGTTWLLQTQLASRVGRVWWASALAPDDSWRHFDLTSLTGGQSTLRQQDAIAVDGLGRLWWLM